MADNDNICSRYTGQWGLATLCVSIMAFKAATWTKSYKYFNKIVHLVCDMAKSLESDKTPLKEYMHHLQYKAAKLKHDSTYRKLCYKVFCGHTLLAHQTRSKLHRPSALPRTRRLNESARSGIIRAVESNLNKCAVATSKEMMLKRLDR